MIQADIKQRIKAIGAWAFARQARNSGMSFTMCYWLMFNRMPRL